MFTGCLIVVATLIYLWRGPAFLRLSWGHVHVHGAFSWWQIDVQWPSPLCASHSLGSWVWAVSEERLLNVTLGEGWREEFFHWLLFQAPTLGFCCGVSWWWTVNCEVNKPFAWQVACGHGVCHNKANHGKSKSLIRLAFVLLLGWEIAWILFMSSYPHTDYAKGKQAGWPSILLSDREI